MDGPLLPAAKYLKQGSEFAQQFVSEAAAVQQQLHEFHERDWPLLVQQSIQEGWTGQYESPTVEKHAAIVTLGLGR